MPAPSKAIILKITDAGKQASLNNNGDSASLSIDLTQVGIGTGQYTPVGNETALQAETERAGIVSGDVETISNTLRFTSAITASAITDVYEIGLFSADGTLFAVAASSTDPLLTVHPDITFVAAFGLSLSEVGAGSVTVTTDPNGALSIVIMEQHLAAPDPHPQYLNKQRVEFLFSLLVPLGYTHTTFSPESPKPLFDELIGIETFWRRLDGMTLVGVDPTDPNISEPALTAGKQGIGTTPADGESPDYYKIRTTYIWERYNPNDIPVRYDGQSNYDGKTSYQ